MYVLEKNDRFDCKNCGVALGNFDGFHLGHMVLINILKYMCINYDSKSLVYTFDKNSKNITRKKFITPIITTIEQRISILQSEGIDYLYLQEFNEEFSTFEPEEFVYNVLVQKLNVKFVVVGYDYRFGYKGRGDISYLRKLGEKYSFFIFEVPKVQINDEKVSSTLIRSLITCGDVNKAYQLMGRCFSIVGEVIHGEKIGRKIGFPTANILLTENYVVPKEGVYASLTKVNNKVYRSLTCIGTRPTFTNGSKTSIETYIVDFSYDIYGEKIEVIFYNRIRKNIKFESVDELIDQMNQDLIVLNNEFWLNNQQKLENTNV